MFGSFPALCTAETFQQPEWRPYHCFLRATLSRFLCFNFLVNICPFPQARVVPGSRYKIQFYFDGQQTASEVHSQPCACKL